MTLLTGDEPLGGRFRKLSLGQYDNDAGGQPAFSKCGWGKPTGGEQPPSLAPFLSPANAKEVCILPPIAWPEPVPTPASLKAGGMVGGWGAISRPGWNPLAPEGAGRVCTSLTWAT